MEFMDQPKIWLSSPHMGKLEEQYVQEAFATNWIAPLGPNVNGFEADLQNYNKVGHVAALSAGTSAIHIALDLLGVGPGDYVLVQSFTFCGSANPITYRGAQPIFIDSELETWNMNPAELGHALTDLAAKGEIKKVKAIMPVHLYGMPAQMDTIMAIAQEYNIPVIEDAAESLGSTYKEKFTGAIGELGVYSFNGNKIITTSGGGALASNNKDLIDQARCLATQARDEAPHYQHSRIGYNYRLSNVLAGIGRGQMAVLDERIAQRRANFTRYQDYFATKNATGYHIIFQEENSHSFSNRWLSAILVDPTLNKGLNREKIRLALGEENIEARPLWKPMHLQPVFADCQYYGSNISETLFDQGLCLPSGSNLTEQDFDRIFAALDQLFI
jgi:dTDP-4-amino-4,6-dideoxygalactose transaminase